MTKVLIHPEDQIKRIDNMTDRLQTLKKLNTEQYIGKPHSKSWCVIEVAEHMVISYNAYRKKLARVLAELPEVEAKLVSVKARRMPSLIMKSLAPKEGKIRFKVKTLKGFEPVFSESSLQDLNAGTVLASLEETLIDLRRIITAYPTKDVKSMRFNSAIGALVKFNLAEACEFIICHNERHFQQIENILQEV